VGEGLVDHVGVGLGWAATERLQQEMTSFARLGLVYMAQVTVRGRSRSCPPGVCDIFLFPAVDPGWEVSGAVFAMKPASRGRVCLRSADPRVPPAIEHGFLSDPADAGVLVEGVAQLRGLVESEPLTGFVASEERPGASADVERYVRENARGFFHPVATCALGRVADERARVFGLENVVVGDASLIPAIPRANTHLSAIAVAERVAELL
jgi:choline dehydrogenase